MERHKWQDILWTCCWAAAAAGMLYLAGKLISGYIFYGENEAHRSQVTEGEQNTQENQTTQMNQIMQNDSVMQSNQASQNVSEKEQTSEDPEYIRVRLLTQDYESGWHQVISVTSEEPYIIIWKKTDKKDGKYEETVRHFAAGEVFAVSSEEMELSEEICICKDGKPEPDGTFLVNSFKRADGYPEYGGELYLYREEQGMELINELPLEEYLYSVVSSEIPSGYPIEAQKAQAVCARTYAKKCMERAEKAGENADLDDSVSYQVYNNYRSSEISRMAVEATAGEVLETEEALYYSTSCLSEKREDLNTDEAFADFLEETPEEDAEYGSAWIRWSTMIDHSTILEQLALLYDFTADRIDRIYAVKRHGNGQVQKLAIVCGDKTFEIEGEYQIRNILSVKETVIRLKDGTIADNMKMLPSAFLLIVDKNSDETERESDGMEVKGEEIQTEETEIIQEETSRKEETSGNVVHISGGGYGHGIGMSQCGAAAMAEDGADYREILRYYYGKEICHAEYDSCPAAGIPGQSCV